MLHVAWPRKTNNGDGHTLTVCTLFERHGSGGNRNTLSTLIGKRNEERENEPEFHQSDGAIKYLGYGPFAILALPLVNESPYLFVYHSVNAVSSEALAADVDQAVSRGSRPIVASRRTRLSDC